MICNRNEVIFDYLLERLYNMEKKNLNELIELIKEAGYKIKDMNVNYSIRYDVPCNISINIITPEYNEAVLNDVSLSKMMKKAYLEN